MSALSSKLVWKRVLERTRAHARPLVVALVASVVSAAAASLWASLVGPLLQSLIRTQAATWGSLQLNAADLSWRVPLAIVALAALKALASWLHSGLMGRVAQRVLGGLRRELHTHLLELPPAWYEVRHSGELLSRFTSDLTQVEFAAAQALSSLVKDSLLVVGLLTVCAVTDVRLFFIIFVALPGTAIPVSRFARSAKKAATRTQNSIGSLSMQLSEQLHALPVVQALRAERASLARFDLEHASYLDAMKRSLFIRGAFSPTTEFLGILGVAGAIVMGTRAVMVEPELSGKLVSFLTAALMLYQPVKALSNTWSELSRATAAAARLFDILDAPVPADHGTPCGPLTQTLRLEAVRLTYPDGREALRGVTATIQAGQLVALVGPSGAGKSSLLAGLLDFSPPTAGHFLWDGVPLASHSRTSRRAQIAWVPQEPVLLSGTIRQNVLLGRSDATDAEVWQALEQAHAAEFVRSFAQGLDEQVAERGMRLSGGQRQRLAIARAFVRKPSLLLLDEPTSALDAASEHEVQQGLEALMRGRTTLVVAHRLSTVKRADCILVMRDGVIVERGTHAELLEQAGVYASLVAAAHGEVLD